MIFPLLSCAAWRVALWRWPFSDDEGTCQWASDLTTSVTQSILIGTAAVSWFCIKTPAIFYLSFILSFTDQCTGAITHTGTSIDMSNISASADTVTRIILPDLVSHCDFEVRINRHRKHAATASKEWLFQGDNLSEKKRQKYHGLKAGLLTAMCYPDAGYAQLRVCSDFMNCEWLLHLWIATL